MNKAILFFVLSSLIIFSINQAAAQDIGLATFQEIAQVIVDKSISQNVTASITLQTTSVQEIKIPAELEQKIREDGRISAITITNQNQCILGVNNESCILINVKRDPGDKNFLQIQNTTLRVANQYIDEINSVFDTDAKLHSTFIHTSDMTSTALETSGIISGKGTVSAVYTMPMEDTSSMYEKMSAILIPKEIRQSGGFFDVAKNLSTQENSKLTFSIIPTQSKSLLQLRLSVDYTQEASSITEINPLKFLKTDELKRSDYFSKGFYPLNSLLQVVVLSPQETNISDVRGNIVQTQLIDGEKMPTEISKPGWIFDPERGIKVEGKYIFGETKSIKSNEVIFSLGGNNLQSQVIEDSFDESIFVVIIITIVAIAATIYYLKGYKK